jgi:hypothetical protein
MPQSPHRTLVVRNSLFPDLFPLLLESLPNHALANFDALLDRPLAIVDPEGAHHGVGCVHGSLGDRGGGVVVRRDLGEEGEGVKEGPSAEVGDDEVGGGEGEVAVGLRVGNGKARRREEGEERTGTSQLEIGDLQCYSRW